MSAAPKINPQTHIKLVVQKGPHEGQRFSFAKNKITIGRSPENDIILVNDPLISRQHAYIEIVDNDVEIVNLSQKNPVLINNESITKWKLTSGTPFVIGASEFNIQIENQQSIVVMKPATPPVPQPAPLKLVKPGIQPVAPPTIQSVSAPKVHPARPQIFSHNVQPSTVLDRPSSFDQKKKFYFLIGIVLVAGLYLGLSESETGKKTKKATLKYSDEVALKINSEESIEALKKQEALFNAKMTRSYVRAEENFLKGVRAYQLNDFSNAIDYLQLALISQPDHILAKRYLYLSKVRFDEILKAKIELGQSYFQRNNFKLCKALFQQVIDMLASKEMLQGTSKETNLKLAEIMVKKCEFAAEGVR